MEMKTFKIFKRPPPPSLITIIYYSRSNNNVVAHKKNHHGQSRFFRISRANKNLYIYIGTIECWTYFLGGGDKGYRVLPL